MRQADIARAFVADLISDLHGRAAADPALTPFIAALSKIDMATPQTEPSPRLDHPSMAILDRACDVAAGNEPLVSSAVTAAKAFDWGLVYGDGGMDEDLANGMVAAQAVGSYGCFAADHVATGLFLVTPGIHYALHTHAAPEIYYCVSGMIEIQHGIDGEPFQLTAGSHSVTPSGRIHSLTTRDEPVVLIYVWIDHMTCPIWIWRQDDAGTWHRDSWRRARGEAWRVEKSEIVTPEEMTAAHR